LIPFHVSFHVEGAEAVPDALVRALAADVALFVEGAAGL
jgi:hypothetical protein